MDEDTNSAGIMLFRSQDKMRAVFKGLVVAKCLEGWKMDGGCEPSLDGGRLAYWW